MKWRRRRERVRLGILMDYYCCDSVNIRSFVSSYVLPNLHFIGIVLQERTLTQCHRSLGRCNRCTCN
ncbi:hypothetical protein L1987_50599 [Smallanthus sonchifolius]|uniref:Uncharacterized protein n=1 Tax=Smallanthus sonchifolius TaxID=185202 RepID=A0ACB9EMC3_9ASTR|nr:hypothetical protein L1987_50599 [Smallanthus sonchifolius]